MTACFRLKFASTCSGKNRCGTKSQNHSNFHVFLLFTDLWRVIVSSKPNHSPEVFWQTIRVKVHNFLRDYSFCHQNKNKCNKISQKWSCEWFSLLLTLSHDRRSTFGFVED